jgi:hypothetical protein
MSLSSPNCAAQLSLYMHHTSIAQLSNLAQVLGTWNVDASAIKVWNYFWEGVMVLRFELRAS